MPSSSQIYLIDCSGIMGFSGADYANPSRFVADREHIWTSLETMIDDGLLKTVPQVMNHNGELEYKDSSSYQRLRIRKDGFIIPLVPGYEDRITHMLANYPKLLRGKLDRYTREPADPYLIDCASQLGYKIVTEELHYNDRAGRNRGKKTTIADVCAAEGIGYCYLNSFLHETGVLQ